MGADLIMAWVTWDKDVELDWDAGKTKLKEIAEKIWREEQPELSSLGEVIVETHLETSYNEAIAALDYVKECVEEGARDIAGATLGSLNICMTGGMSWGDDPSDSFSEFDRVNAFPDEVHEAIGLNTGHIPDYRAWFLKTIELHPQILPTLMGIDPQLDKIIESRLKEI